MLKTLSKVANGYLFGNKFSVSYLIMQEKKGKNVRKRAVHCPQLSTIYFPISNLLKLFYSLDYMLYESKEF